MKFEFFQSKKDHKYYFRLKARNGEIVMKSQGYRSKAGAVRGAQCVQKYGKDEDNYETKTSKNRKSFFNLKAKNGRIIGSSQIYTQLASCQKTIQSIIKSKIRF